MNKRTIQRSHTDGSQEPCPASELSRDQQEIERFQCRTIPRQILEDIKRRDAALAAGLDPLSDLQLPPVDEVPGPNAPSIAPKPDKPRGHWSRHFMRGRHQGALEFALAYTSTWLARASSRFILLGFYSAVTLASVCLGTAIMIRYYPEKLGAGYFHAPGSSTNAEPSARTMPVAPAPNSSPVELQYEAPKSVETQPSAINKIPKLSKGERGHMRQATREAPALASPPIAAPPATEEAPLQRPRR